MTKPKVLLAIDRPDWAFANIARQVRVRLRSDFEFTTCPYMKLIKDPPTETYDVIVAFWWASVEHMKQAGVKAKRWMTTFYDTFSWIPGSPLRERMHGCMQHTDLLAFGNEAFEAEHFLSFAHDKPSFILEDGVDTQLFQPQPLPNTFTVGWCGNSASTKSTVGDTAPERKGLSIIQAACEQVGLPLKTLNLADGTSVPHLKMPEFYRDISVYVNASESEGTPNTVLEAAACGRPVVTTRVGITHRVVAHGLTGLFVERDKDAIASALDALQSWNLTSVGATARQMVIPHDWSYKIEYWRAALHACMLG